MIVSFDEVTLEDLSGLCLAVIDGDKKLVLSEVKMFVKLMKWVFWHRPIITTRSKMKDIAIECSIIAVEREREYMYAIFHNIIRDLEKLRPDTWNQDAITRIQDKIRRG